MSAQTSLERTPDEYDHAHEAALFAAIAAMPRARSCVCNIKMVAPPGHSAANPFPPRWRPSSSTACSSFRPTQHYSPICRDKAGD